LVTDTLWSEFLNIVREEVGSRVIETWFKAVIFVRWDPSNKTVYLQAPNPFVKDWLTTHYMPLFAQSLGRLLHEQQVTVVFVHNEAQGKPPQEPATPPAQFHEKKESFKASTSITIQPAVPSLAKASPHQAQLRNQQYRFNNFVVGPHNSLAYAAAYAITEKPGRLYNPFFIYGRSGLGKTHLLHAIGNEIKEHNKNFRVVYQSADRFINEFINAIRFDKVYQFEAKYKDADLLLVDDIQFLSNKEQTQEAFFHIFNMLHQAQKQIVFTSDSLPRDIAGLAERMRSRLESGLVTDISLPTLETKIAIIKKKAEALNETISDEVADYIASLILSNIRELEGALIRVFAFASLTHQPLTLELTQKVLERTKETKTPAIDLQKIGSHVAKHFDYSLQEIRSSKRDKDLTLARHVAIYLMKHHTNHSLREIGKFLQRKDHSTVLHAIDKVEERKKKDATFSYLMKQLEHQLCT
jgi:chromosomal replication initiator protein